MKIFLVSLKGEGGRERMKNGCEGNGRREREREKGRTNQSYDFMYYSKRGKRPNKGQQKRQGAKESE
jgi:hypothetical protein